MPEIRDILGISNINNSDDSSNDGSNIFDFKYSEEYFSKKRNYHIISDYDINLVHQEHLVFMKKIYTHSSETLIAKEYIEMINKYNIFATINECKIACSIFKSVYPRMAKHICNLILQTNQETKDLTPLERRRIYKDSQIFNITRLTSGNEYKIYQIFKERKPICYKIFMEKKFSMSLNNIIITLNKISCGELIYINNQLYCFNGCKWTANKEELAITIRNILLEHFNTEAMRVNYQPNLTKLYNIVFINRLIAHYKRSKYHQPTMTNIKLDYHKKEYIYFKNHIFGMPHIHAERCSCYFSTDYNTLSTGYDFEDPKGKSIKNIKKLLGAMIPDLSIRNTLVNACCSALLYQNINLLIVLRGNTRGIDVMLNMMLAMLGDYGVSLDSNLLFEENNIKSLVHDKRFVVFRNYRGGFINNNQLIKVLNTNDHSTYFLEAKEDLRFKAMLPYSLSRKIVEIEVMDDVDDILINNVKDYDMTNAHKSSLFFCLMEYFQKKKYLHHTCNTMWYYDNVDRKSKLRVTKYKEYNKLHDKFFGI